MLLLLLFYVLFNSTAAIYSSSSLLLPANLQLFNIEVLDHHKSLLTVLYTIYTMSDAQIMTALTSALTESAILRPGSTEFEKDNGSYFSAFENEITPSFIAKPATVKQVQDLILALRPHLLDGSCQVAVRGTGHTPFAGSANIQNGVTIDTRGLKGINIGDGTVEVGSGETWETIYTELEKHGLTTAGGRVGRVGVAGLVLGGMLLRLNYRTWQLIGF